jgi:hypothetical protein
VTDRDQARQRLLDALNEEHNPSYWGGEPRDAEQLVSDFENALAEKNREASAPPEPFARHLDRKGEEEAP